MQGLCQEINASRAEYKTNIITCEGRYNVDGHMHIMKERMIISADTEGHASIYIMT